MSKLKEKLQSIWQSRHLLFKLAREDLKKRYAGSALGIIWAYVIPLVSLLVMWFVFEFGLKSNPVEGDIPFIAWLAPGYISWTFFNDVTLQSTNVYPEYSFLVKKVKFKVRMLPVIKVLSSLFIHLFFIVVAIIICLCCGVYPTWKWFEILYYLVGLVILSTGVSFIVSSLSPFFKDFAQVVTILLQIGFWYTPVFWSINTDNKVVTYLIEANPMYYIVTGYRNALLTTGGHFYESPWLTLYFWGVTIVIFILGMICYKKMRPHFSDVL